MVGRYLSTLIIALTLFMSFTRAYAASGSSISISPGYSGCVNQEIEVPQEAVSALSTLWPSSPDTSRSFLCHKEWTRVFSSLQWKATLVEGRLIWKPQLSYGPDLMFSAIAPSNVKDKGPIISISPNTKVKLVWNTSPSAVTCSAEGGWKGAKPTKGEEEVTPTSDGTNTYVLSCTNKHGEQTTAMALAIVKADGRK
jgi:hypothetical protein